MKTIVATDGRHTRPTETPGCFDAFVDFALGTEFRDAEKFANDFRCDDQSFAVLPSAIRRACLRVMVPISRSEIANAGFAREAVDDLLQAGIGELNVLADF